MGVIEIEGLTKDYGNGRGIFDVHIEVQKGEVFGFLGPNGAGKTTTIRNLMGFITPDSGSCRILGMDCFREAKEIERHLGYLAGEIAFLDDMTGQEMIRFIMELKGIRDHSRMEELMQRFELDPRGKIRRMSKGMKQKIGIITAFMGNPEVVILDEPTSGLDPLMQNRFVELILEEKRKGTTILMSSHIFEEIERTCDRTAIIRQGHIVAVEDMESLQKKKQKTYLLTCRDAVAAENLSQLILKENNLELKQLEGRRLECAVKEDLNKFLKLVSTCSITDLDVKTQTLEEIFMHFYGREEQ